MNKKYKAVIIGCGRIGAEEWHYPIDIRPATHAAAYFNHPKTKLSGLCDVSRKNLKKIGKFFSGVPLYISAEEMLKEVKPDIVSIATHPDTHFKFVKMAADHGVRAIVCEKPISDSLLKAEKMVKYCQTKKCFLFINHSRHLDPLLKKWKARVKNGLLGRVLQVNCLYHNGILNNGTHTIDLLRMLLGEAEKVIGFYNYLTTNPKKGKNIDAIIFFKNGIRAVLQSMPKESGFTEWFFYGEKGSFALKKLGLEICYKNSKIGKPRSLMSSVVSHVVSCLEGRTKPESTGKDGLAALKIIYAIEKSAKNNGKITKCSSI